jgi:hypothetical protein
MKSISLESLISSGCFHLIAACMFGHWLLCWLDSRKLAAVPKIVLSGIALSASLRSLAYAEQSSQRIVWGICCLLAVFALLQSIRQWVTATPVQLHDEAQQLSAKTSKLKKETDKPQGGSRAAASPPIIGLVGSLVAIGCLLYVKHFEFWSLPSPTKYFAGLEVVGTTLMLGIALFLCLELTIISTPDALNATSQSARVHWRTVARLGMVTSVLLLICCLAQFLQKPAAPELSPDDKMINVAARVFGLMVLLATFVVWMVPRRLANCQRTNSIPQDWVSLTLSAWLGMLAFLVVATLPADWPWRILIQ